MIFPSVSGITADLEVFSWVMTTSPDTFRSPPHSVPTSLASRPAKVRGSRTTKTKALSHDKRGGGLRGAAQAEMPGQTAAPISQNPLGLVRSGPLSEGGGIISPARGASAVPPSDPVAHANAGTPPRAVSVRSARNVRSARPARSPRSAKEHAVLTDLSPATARDSFTPEPVSTSAETPQERSARYTESAVPLMGKLYGYAQKKTSNHALAQDLVQQAYERGWRHFDKFEPGSNFSAWMFTILSRVIANHYRAAAARPQTTVVDDLETWNEVQAASVTSPEFASAENRALELMPDEAVVAALMQVPEVFREPVYLADAEGFSYKEISEMLDIPIGTVMSRLHRGRARLRELLMDVAIERGYHRPETQEAGA